MNPHSKAILSILSVVESSNDCAIALEEMAKKARREYNNNNNNNNGNDKNR
jgi:hypothetical protein